MFDHLSKSRIDENFYVNLKVCGTAVGLTGDIFRALKLKALPYCDEIMTLLIENLGDSSVHRSVKPQILSVFGDIVLSIGPEFKKYLDVVLATLTQASQAQVSCPLKTLHQIYFWLKIF